MCTRGRRSRSTDSPRPRPGDAQRGPAEWRGPLCACHAHSVEKRVHGVAEDPEGASASGHVRRSPSASAPLPELWQTDHQRSFRRVLVAEPPVFIPLVGSAPRRGGCTSYIRSCKSGHGAALHLDHALSALRGSMGKGHDILERNPETLHFHLQGRSLNRSG